MIFKNTQFYYIVVISILKRPIDLMAAQHKIEQMLHGAYRFFHHPLNSQATGASYCYLET